MISAPIYGYGHSSGSAIKGEALSSGLAGNFIGDVAVNGDLVCNGFQFTASPTTGHVLTSDAFGNGVWQAPAAAADSDWTINGDDMYTEIAGDLGIGTDSPTSKVHILGAGHESLVLESTSSWGSVEFIGKTSAGVNDYLVLSKYGPTASGTIDGIPLAGKARVGSGVESEGLLLEVLSTDPMYFLTAADEQMRLTSDGYLGIGTTTPGAQLEVLRADVGTVFESVAGSAAGQVNRFDCNADLSQNNDLLELEIGVGSSTICQFIECEVAPADVKFRVGGDGEVTADGSFTGGGADFAEMIEVSEGAMVVEPGDVLVIDVANPRSVVRCRDAQSTLVAGIYSTQPGFVGSTREWDVEVTDGEGETLTRADMAAQFNEIPMAVVGIVPCKVSTENGSITIGDLLVTSSTPGHAMRAESPRAGTILGKALEGFSAGTGVIKVLVTLQ